MGKLSIVALAVIFVFGITPAAKADSFGTTFLGTAPPSINSSIAGDFYLTTSGGTATAGSLTIDNTEGVFVAGTYTLSSGGFLNPTLGEFVFTGVGGTIDLFDVNGAWQIEFDGENVTNDALELTPEPSSLLLLGSGLLALAAIVFWKSRSSKSCSAGEPPSIVAQMV